MYICDSCNALAIYYFFVEYVTRTTGGYHGEVDNLLFYFAFNYSLIQRVYQKQERVFPRIENYVASAEARHRIDRDEDSQAAQGRKRPRTDNGQ